MMIRGKLNLCDLAGSEKIGLEENLGQQHLLELKTINLSLSSLGKVISSLAQGKKQTHIPYRDSKLTRLLQDSLGGNTKTTLIAAVSPLVECTEETISTLKFADRAKKVMVKVQANEFNAADDALITKLQKEVQHLKEILNLKRRGGANDVHQQLLQLKEENARLKEMANKVTEVERLKQENKLMRLELQKIKTPNQTDGFQNHLKLMAGSDQNSVVYAGGGDSTQREQNSFLMVSNGVVEEEIQSEKPKDPGFFMTEMDYPQGKNTSPSKQAHHPKSWAQGMEERESRPPLLAIETGMNHVNLPSEIVAMSSSGQTTSQVSSEKTAPSVTAGGM